MLEKGHSEHHACIFVRVALLFYGNAEQTLQISELQYHSTMTLTLTTTKVEMLFNMIDYQTQGSIKSSKTAFSYRNIINGNQWLPRNYGKRI